MVNNPPTSARDADLLSGSGRAPRGENGNPLQYSCLENSIERSLEGNSPWGRKEWDTTEQLSIANTHTHTHTHTHRHTHTHTHTHTPTWS